MKNKMYRKLTITLLFSISFIIIGWIAPVMYATYSPQESYIVANNFTAENASIDNNEHSICFERKIKRAAEGEVFTRLFLVSEDGDRIEVRSQNKKRVFSTGTDIIRLQIDLPENITAGVYRYERIYNMELASGRVDRQFRFKSDKFTITNSKANENNTVSCLN